MPKSYIGMSNHIFTISIYRLASLLFLGSFMTFMSIVALSSLLSLLLIESKEGFMFPMLHASPLHKLCLDKGLSQNCIGID